MKITLKKIALVCLALAATSLTASVQADVQRLEKWSSGDSEFEAVKAGYKVIIGDALTLASGQRSKDAMRRQMERELEEDFKKIKQRFVPVSSENCERVSAKVECHIVASVRMSEIEGWVQENIANAGRGNARLADVSYVLMSKSSDEAVRDFMPWLHNKLEQDFGHDVYYSDSYVSPDTIRGDCGELRSLLQKSEKQGAGQRANRYRQMLDLCDEFASSDVIVVVEGFDMDSDAFNSRDGSMAGRAKIRLAFFQTQSRRPLTSPKPKRISQYGYGGSSAGAAADLQDRLYQDAANYIAAQFNQIVVAAVKKQKLKGLDEKSSIERYQLLVTGASSDLPEGRSRLKFLRQWFAQRFGNKLIRDIERGDVAENYYQFQASETPDWDGLVDDIYQALEQQGLTAKVDIDRNANLVIAFNSSDAQAAEPVEVAINTQSAKRKIKVKSAELVLRRRDPATGIAIAINEAVLEIENRSKSDVMIAMNPVWENDAGVREKDDFSHEKHLVLKGKSTQSFVFRAPNKYAVSTTIEISCPHSKCKVK